MAKFFVHGENWNTGEKKVFIYDNEYSTITDQMGNPVDLSRFEESYKHGGVYPLADPFDKDNPIEGKSNQPKTLKIQLGLFCNYSCDYCTQALHANATTNSTPQQLDDFFEKISNLDLSHTQRVELWGGEPLVYWKTIRKLVPRLREQYPELPFFMITNGSLLSDEIIEFLDEYDFSIAISHDGPGHKEVRGPDPLDDPDQYKMIRKLYDRLSPKGRISLNCVLTKNNYSRKEIYDFLVDKFDENLVMGEGGFIDVYNEGGKDLSLYEYEDMVEFRRSALSDLYVMKRDKVTIFNNKVVNFISSVVNGRKSKTLGQGCGMDKKDKMAIDIKGNVISCQDVSANMESFFDGSHNIGTVEKLDEVKLNSGMHWSNRPNCSNCPVLQNCGGSCYLLNGEYWNYTCNNSYNDEIVFFMYAFETMTGFLPYYIDGDKMPEWRKDVLGMDKPDRKREKEKQQLKDIPILVA